MFFEYDTQKIHNLLSEFYTLTKIKTVFYDSNLNVISAVPFDECSFCTELSKSEESCKKCNNCTIDGLRCCREKNGLVIYKCHAGLIEAATPVRFKDVIVGYIMLGQILKEEDRKTSANNMIEYAKQYMGNMVYDYFNEIICKSETEILAATKIMESCVCYILMNNIIEAKQHSVVFTLSQYIENNPCADLSVDALCQKFKLSRNNLYKISGTYFGMPIADYVRKKRLFYAKKLIEEGVSLTLAAEQAGFYDYGYFGKIFKQYVGETPSKIRKNSIN